MYIICLNSKFKGRGYELAVEAYEKLINSGISEEQIEGLLKEKKRTYGEYMSVDSMLYLIAEEQGLIKKKYEGMENGFEVDYGDFVIKINQIIEGMSHIVVQGRVCSRVTIKEFAKKDGTPGLIGHFYLKDKTDEIKAVVWDDTAKQLDKHSLKFNDSIRIVNGYCKKGREEQLEIHLGKRGFVDFSPEGVSEKNFPLLEKYSMHKIAERIKLEEISVIESKFATIVEGTVSNLEFKEIVKRNGSIEFLLSFKLSDETDSLRVVAFGMPAVSAYKELKKADRVSISNLRRSINSFTKKCELIFTSKTEYDYI